jgi:hypothetical protein
MENQFKLIKKQENSVDICLLLFTDLIMVTKKKKKSYLLLKPPIPLEEVLILGINRTSFALLHMRLDNYTFECLSQLEMKTWIQGAGSALTAYCNIAQFFESLNAEAEKLHEELVSQEQPKRGRPSKKNRSTASSMHSVAQISRQRSSQKEAGKSLERISQNEAVKSLDFLKFSLSRDRALPTSKTEPDLICEDIDSIVALGSDEIEKI